MHEMESEEEGHFLRTLRRAPKWIRDLIRRRLMEMVNDWEATQN